MARVSMEFVKLHSRAQHLQILLVGGVFGWVRLEIEFGLSKKSVWCKTLEHGIYTDSLWPG